MTNNDISIVFASFFHLDHFCDVHYEKASKSGLTNENCYTNPQWRFLHVTIQTVLIGHIETLRNASISKASVTHKTKNKRPQA